MNRHNAWLIAAMFGGACLGVAIGALLAVVVEAAPPEGPTGKLTYSVAVYGVAHDGPGPTRTPEPPTPTPTPEPTPVVEPEAPMTVVDYIALWPWDVALFIAIADCESEFDPWAYNETPVYDDRGREHHAAGPFQLLTPMHDALLFGASPFDAEAGVRAAYYLFARDGLSPWKECLPW